MISRSLGYGRIFHWLRLALSLGLVAALGACAAGNTVDYTKSSLTLAAHSDKSLAVAVDDKRPYVVSGENSVTFVGVVRGGVGVPFGVHTTSGQPFATDFAKIVMKALQANGVRATSTPVAVSPENDTATKALLTLGADRSLLVTIRDWHSDKYLTTDLTYALDAAVLDKSGMVVAENHVADKKTIGSDFTAPIANMERGGNEIAQQALHALLDDPRMVEAMR